MNTVQYAVVLCFDESFEKQVKEIWEQVDYIGFVPHITLADYKELELGEYNDAFKNLFRNKSKMTIKFNGLGCFLENNTLYLSPTMTKELWDLHQIYHTELDQFNKNPNSYYLKNRWIPHCTLKSRIADYELNKLISKLTLEIKPSEATIEKVKLIEFTYEDGTPIDAKTILTKEFL